MDLGILAPSIVTFLNACPLALLFYLRVTLLDNKKNFQMYFPPHLPTCSILFPYILF